MTWNTYNVKIVLSKGLAPLHGVDGRTNENRPVTIFEVRLLVNVHILKAADVLAVGLPPLAK
eukprot:6211279-Pleurochrysis_carterae.AAC.5